MHISFPIFQSYGFAGIESSKFLRGQYLTGESLKRALIRKLKSLGLKGDLCRKFINKCSSREISSLLRRISPEISKISPAGIKVPKRSKFCLESGTFQTPVKDKKSAEKIVEVYRISKEKKDQKMRNCQQLSSFIVSSSKSTILFHLHALQNTLDPMKFQVSMVI